MISALASKNTVAYSDGGILSINSLLFFLMIHHADLMFQFNCEVTEVSPLKHPLLCFSLPLTLLVLSAQEALILCSDGEVHHLAL